MYLGPDARPGRTDKTDVASPAAMNVAAPAIATRVVLGAGTWLLRLHFLESYFSIYILLINDYGDEMIPVVGISNVVVVGCSEV